jgi:enoyl-CoA hydratase
MISSYVVERRKQCLVLRLHSNDETNRLTRECVRALCKCIQSLAAGAEVAPLIVTGNQKFFSAGADLREISQLNAPAALEFSRIGQELMQAVEEFPAPVYAAISGYCMGGGLDLALACRHRIASPHAVFGHRGAALGLMTGWGGTQRLPRLIGKSRSLAMFVAAEKIMAAEALQIGLVDAIAHEPVAEAMHRIESRAALFG